MRVAMMFEHSGWLLIELEQELGKNHRVWQAGFVLNTTPCLEQLTIDYLLMTTTSRKMYYCIGCFTACGSSFPLLKQIQSSKGKKC